MFFLWLCWAIAFVLCLPKSLMKNSRVPIKVNFSNIYSMADTFSFRFPFPSLVANFGLNKVWRRRKGKTKKYFRRQHCHFSRNKELSHKRWANFFHTFIVPSFFYDLHVSLFHMYLFYLSIYLHVSFRAEEFFTFSGCFIKKYSFLMDP